jgi:hypothetical protein
MLGLELSAIPLHEERVAAIPVIKRLKGFLKIVINMFIKKKLSQRKSGGYTEIHRGFLSVNLGVTKK